ncbi:MAE_28990/MAE_18760 family HEPN-like nuclease [Aeromonas hydrophila]|uniref:MAE_28990/MAE_18760 family HEPN-like nuclease n=1 Tax=Aeromonas hydrophila TaxID=644 RepID=UPI00330652DF
MKNYTEEATCLLNMIKDGSNINESTITKASVILILYNHIESKITTSLTVIHDEISAFDFSLFNESIRGLFCQYHLHGKKTHHLRTGLQLTIEKSLFLPPYLEFSKSVKLYSGNLDLKKIQEILKKYSIPAVKLSESDAKNILKIKNHRNILAHGERSFKEVGRMLSVRDIEQLITSTNTLLDKIDNSINIYLRNKKYLKK